MAVELLSPAGNMEKLISAVNFGADAVYLSGKDYGLRANTDNFSLEEMENAFDFLREKGKKGYVTINIYARNNDFNGLKNYLYDLKKISPDALIISDPGVFKLVRDLKIDIPIHISTQSNVTNYMAVEFWRNMGADRVVLARELSRDEIKFIAEHVDCELEVFVHGAICISHSGRCVLSNYFNNKDSNRGECTHPCRWSYHLVEETRPGEYLPVFEDERGTYIYNSKDLCLIEHIGELVDMGVKSFKIEGRMKTAMYVSVVTGVYRKAIDMALRGNFKVDEDWIKILHSVSNRGYTKGFYAKEVDESSINYKTSAYSRGADFLGVVYDYISGKVFFHSKGKIQKGDLIEILTPKFNFFDLKIESIFDLNGVEVEFTKPNYDYFIMFDEEVQHNSLIRRYR
ncbi:MAG: U32 family peptidase [Calditerrivibrio sp.]|nr:U32 family peptidase [Calditerrivibrio sp.]MCA1932383.1 U32 family peptidase [Calditerrivibrio sp.]MCA1981070.1 U32 family peptidase [Calditerrivibrio sp.]